MFAAKMASLRFQRADLGNEAAAVGDGVEYVRADLLAAARSELAEATIAMLVLVAFLLLAWVLIGAPTEVRW